MLTETQGTQGGHTGRLRTCQRELHQRQVCHCGRGEGGERKEMKALENHPRRSHRRLESFILRTHLELRSPIGVCGPSQLTQRPSKIIRSNQPGIARELITTSENLANHINSHINSGHNHEPSMMIWTHRNIFPQRRHGL